MQTIFVVIIANLFLIENFLIENYIFIPTFNLFILYLLFSTIILNVRFKYRVLLIIFYQFLFFINYLSYSYQMEFLDIKSIKLIFTHLDDSIDSISILDGLYQKPLIISIFFATIISLFAKFLRSDFRFNILFLLIIFLDLDYFKSNKSSLEKLTNDEVILQKVEVENDINIILIFAESLRADRFYNKILTPKLNQIDRKYLKFSQSIYSLATSTDVTIPLFINQARDTGSIDMSLNLFKLAKTSNFNTYFISAQSKKSLKHIQEYLKISNIDYYNDSTLKDDIVLLDEFNSINLDSNKNFVVMQMIGEHSPYRYYPKEFEKYRNYDSFFDRVNSNYNNSVLYTDTILWNIISETLKSSSKNIIIVTSDHGEMLGESGRYGHNKFYDSCYRVPLNIYSNFNLKINNRINSHLELSRYISYLLGFDIYAKHNSSIIVNGSMITGEDGYTIFEYPN